MRLGQVKSWFIKSLPPKRFQVGETRPSNQEMFEMLQKQRYGLPGYLHGQKELECSHKGNFLE